MTTRLQLAAAPGPGAATPGLDGEPDPGAGMSPGQLGRYELQGLIGEGSMGQVWRAHDPLLARTVALKTIRRSLLGSAGAAVAATARLRNEAQAAARLSHPGIVSVYEYGEDGDQSFIAMEYVHGTPLLAGLAPTETLPMDDVLCLMVQLLAALQCAHDQGVWHRDIKPANLMITPAGRLKIADFGIARIDAVALTQEASVMGSPGYMAPECYSGIGVDWRCDLYACGVLLYELLMGVRPYRGGPDIVMYKTLHLPVPPLVRDDVPGSAALAPFEAVVRRAMAKTPSDRFASALEMREALTRAAPRPVPSALSAQAMQGLVPGAVGPGAGSVPSSPPRSRPPLPTPTAVTEVAPSGTHVAATDLPGHFPAELLNRLARELAPELGAVAQWVVRRAAARSDSLAALLLRVANDALPADERQAFIERHRAALRSAPSAGRPATPLPVLGDTPLQPGLQQAARTLLLRRLGPIASWMVNQAAAQAATREQFIARLADLAAEGPDRERLRAALCRLR
jgi:eukaryotic-like serine/threonine-protein kinase